MRENRKPVILGEKTNVLLWGFKVALRDRRDKELTDGYIVVTGNEEYDIDEATKEIRDKYARLGYEVTECEYDDSRTFLFDALEVFREAEQPTRCKSCTYYINQDDSVGQQEGCEVIDDEGLKEGNIEKWQTVIDCNRCGGRGCPCFELSRRAKKEPEDKPDYLAEIMAALDELEEGGRVVGEKQINNAVALMGVIASEIEEIDNINGLQYRGWAMQVETVRHSGVADYAVVIMPYDTYVEDLDVGTVVMAIGKMQTFKEFKTGKVLVYALADYVESVQGEHWQDQNEIQLIGNIGKGTVYRETPKGKRITDIKLVIPNELRKSNCYIPCICWNEAADEAKDWKEGTQVVIKGRLQSRQYIKRINEDTEEQRTCYEVSVNNIKKVEA